MPDVKPTNRERLREITDGIEQGIKEMFESEKYRRYLSVMSRFHHYSVNNQMLIYMQRPDATLVAGFNKWKNQFQRHVKKGEKGITIIAPTPFKKKIEKEKLDPDTRMPMLDQDGKVITEEKEIEIPMFKPVKVFDAAQTEGKPLPQLVSSLSGDVKDYEVFMEALRRTSQVPIIVEPMEAGMDGYFHLEKQEIFLREGMSQVQTVSAAIHEIAHSRLHNYDTPFPENAPLYQEIEIFGVPALFSNGRIPPEQIPDGLFCYDLRGSDYDSGHPTTLEEYVAVNHAGSILTAQALDIPSDGAIPITDEDGINFVGGDITAYQFRAEQKKDQKTEEVEAESISYAVCQYFGIETAENSFGYIATWSQGKELKELRASLETINKTSSELISGIEKNYREICKERGIDLTEDAPAQEPPQLPEAPEQKLDEYPMPDSTLKVADLEASGYMDGDMLPLSKDRAAELFQRDLTVYAIVGRNAEMLFDREELDAYTPGTTFAVSREEWEKSPMFHERIEERLQHQEERENAFLHHAEDCFAIYQVKMNDPDNVRFMNLDWMQSHGKPIERSSYDLIYTAPLTVTGSTEAKLEALFEQFNFRSPVDYHSPSLSVSDIVALNQAGVISYHYCDSVGFKELPDFQKENYLKSAEMSTEDDYGMIDGIINNGKQPTVAELEQQAHSGQPISLMDLAEAVHREKKASVLEKLKDKPQQPPQKTKPHKTKEKEL